MKKLLEKSTGDFMKGFLIGILTLGSLSAIAGTLENRDTGEEIEMQLNYSNQHLQITSRAIGIQDQFLNLKQVHGDDSQINLVAGTSSVLAYAKRTMECHECGAGEFAYVVIPATLAYDVVLLPVKAPAKLIQQMVYNKDFSKFLKAASTKEVVTVSNKRFKRIMRILK